MSRLSVCRLTLFFVFLTVLGQASIIKVPPTTMDPKYHDLLCTEEDKATIYELISTMAENGKIRLLFNKSHLESLGAQINHVHPLKFLAVIFSNPRLKFCMFEVFDDYFKRVNFIDGLTPSLDKEADRGKLGQYLADFSNEVHVPSEIIKPYFDARDWENLLRLLIQSP